MLAPLDIRNPNHYNLEPDESQLFISQIILTEKPGNKSIERAKGNRYSWFDSLFMHHLYIKRFEMALNLMSS